MAREAESETPIAANSGSASTPVSNWTFAGRNIRVGAHDPFPFEDTAAFWRTMAQVATILMAVIMFGAFLYVARPLLMPILGALIVSLTLGPLAGSATRHGLPAWVPALAIVILIAAALYVAIVLVSEPASDLIARSSEIGTAIKEKFRFMDRPLAAIQELRAEIMGASGLSVDVNQPAEVIGNVLGAVTPAVLQFVLFFATLFFFVFGRAAMRRYVVNIFSTRDGRLRALKIVNDIERSLSGYLITVTIINAGVGLFAVAVTWVLGFPAPLLWGALAFILNYIPYVGPGIMHAILFFIGLLTFDTLWPALIAPAIFMTFTFIEGHFLVPSIIGKQLLMHPLAVFLSLAFWAWLWGPIGAFLATPILIMATVASDHLYPRQKNMLPD
ncbi:AI-2E family transporter [Pseudorhodoplanes sinuspersici]|nr:AI-2E family transporter [Pseudorhodoplanes sinuspersici]RKE72966.1 putative PurR-regulated permease PerM [Pseudorhodoplanes sinuspersici]